MVTHLQTMVHPMFSQVDQELASLLVGPVPVGVVNKFIFDADPPSPDLIPASELVSVDCDITVMFVTKEGICWSRILCK